MKKKLLSVALATIIAVMAISGASLAWLQDTTDPVTNTFTEGLVEIDLFEHEYKNGRLTTEEIRNNGNTYKMVPGDVLPKDPTVVVKADSEACWLFVKIEKSENFDSFMTFDVADGWIELDGFDGVYYREVSASDAKAGISYPVLADNEVTVKGEEVTLEMMKALEAGTAQRPTLSFTAYAVQKANVTTAAAAWAIINPANP